MIDDGGLFGLGDHYRRQRLWAPPAARRASVKRRLRRELAEANDAMERGDAEGAEALAHKAQQLDAELDRIESEIGTANAQRRAKINVLARALLGAPLVGQL